MTGKSHFPDLMRLGPGDNAYLPMQKLENSFNPFIFNELP